MKNQIFWWRCTELQFAAVVEKNQKEWIFHFEIKFAQYFSTIVSKIQYRNPVKNEL